METIVYSAEHRGRLQRRDLDYLADNESHTGYGDVLIGMPNGDLHQITGSSEVQRVGYRLKEGLLLIYSGGELVRTYGMWGWVDGDKYKNEAGRAAFA